MKPADTYMLHLTISTLKGSDSVWQFTKHDGYVWINRNIIDLNNEFLPAQCQAIIYINVDLSFRKSDISFNTDEFLVCSLATILVQMQISQSVMIGEPHVSALNVWHEIMQPKSSKWLSSIMASHNNNGHNDWATNHHLSTKTAPEGALFWACITEKKHA